ncbi:MAG: hypothetical protein GY938_30870 [Ketobacter sp.]|nr:hypothetical protein [Ketobacter sp.]
MAIQTWAAEDPKAKRISVYYEGTNTVYEGMLVHYNHDTTTNWSGVDKSQAEGYATRDTDTPEGSQNEGKWIRVEEPSDANRRFPAGVVAQGSPGIGTTGPSVIDIYVMNGAIVPVYTDRSVSINEGCFMEIGQNTLVNLDLGQQVGYFMETIDRSSTAGLALAVLNGVDFSDTAAASTLGVGLSPLLWGDAPKVNPYEPGDGVHYFDDFQGELDPTTACPWTITQVDTKGTISHEAGAAGGVINFTNGGDSADDGINAQKTNIAVTPLAGRNIWFEARVKTDQADEQWAIGLCAVDTTVIASGVWDDVSDKVMFGHHTGTADKIDLITARGATEDDTADAADMTDNTWVTLGFKITGLTKVEFYVDGVLTETGETAAAIPNATMVLTAVSQYEAAGGILSVDWVKVIADGGRDA